MRIFHAHALIRGDGKIYYFYVCFEGVKSGPISTINNSWPKGVLYKYETWIFMITSVLNETVRILNLSCSYKGWRALIRVDRLLWGMTEIDFSNEFYLCSRMNLRFFKTSLHPSYIYPLKLSFNWSQLLRINFSVPLSLEIVIKTFLLLILFEYSLEMHPERTKSWDYTIST